MLIWLLIDGKAWYLFNLGFSRWFRISQCINWFINVLAICTVCKYFLSFDLCLAKIGNNCSFKEWASAECFISAIVRNWTVQRDAACTGACTSTYCTVPFVETVKSEEKKKKINSRFTAAFQNTAFKIKLTAKAECLMATLSFSVNHNM